ncbi:MAG: gamma-glutamyltransferase family protein [Actinomycetota bacterium]|nr:gamma-glutamyltransferase family protein [Actinomycetota bacterium]
MITTRPELRGTYGMVASTHWLASSAGMALLERGGNAFDAAVATGLVLQVVEPHLNGPGGEVPIIFHAASAGHAQVLNGQGPAPAAASIEHFRELGLDLVPGTGLLPACVPGAFDAWMRLLAEYGTLRLGEVMSYAIGYAEHGYPVVPRITATIRSVEQLFREEWQESARVYLSGDGPPRPGTLFRNPDLARTYQRIMAEAEAATDDRDGQIDAARRAFYRGFVAEAIDGYLEKASVVDSSGSRHGGLLTAEDLTGYQADLEDPTRLDYHGYTVCKTAPWGQGPVFLQQLSLLQGFDLEAMGHNSPDFVHTVVESAKLAFADREAWYGDPRFVDVPLAGLLDLEYVAQRRTLIGPSASHELRPGTVGGREPRLPRTSSDGRRSAVGVGEPTVARLQDARRLSPAGAGHGVGPDEGDTCHLDVVDRHGNMVSATPSGGWLQSSPVVPGLGFGLGTRAQMFWLQPGLPNSLAGGKRPRTTLTPSLALRDGKPALAFGTPGGDTQDQWSLVFFLAHVHFGLDLQAAIDAPMFHTTHFPSSFYPREAAPGRIHLEGRFPPDVVAELESRGHEVVVEADWSLGRLCAAGREADDGQLSAGADPRSTQGYAVGR